MAVRTVTTVDELLALPGDGLHHELVGGVHYTSPPPNPHHGQVADNVLHARRRYEREQAGWAQPAPTGVMLHHRDSFGEPDVLCVRQEHLDRFAHGAFVHGPPDLIVEVLSPCDEHRDLVAKRDDTMCSDAAPGLTIAVDEVLEIPSA